jgi:hypothetical protein
MPIERPLDPSADSIAEQATSTLSLTTEAPTERITFALPEPRGLDLPSQSVPEPATETLTWRTAPEQVPVELPRPGSSGRASSTARRSVRVEPGSRRTGGAT